MCWFSTMSYARVLFREKNKKRTSRHVSPVPVTRVLLGCHARPVTRGESLSSAAEAPREGNHSYAMFMASWVILILLLLLPVLCEYVLHCKKGFPHFLGFDALQQVLRPHLLAQVLELHSGLQHRVHVHDDGCQADLRPRLAPPSQWPTSPRLVFAERSSTSTAALFCLSPRYGLISLSRFESSGALVVGLAPGTGHTIFRSMSLQINPRL